MTTETAPTFTAWDYLANACAAHGGLDDCAPEAGIYDRAFRVKGGRVVWEHVRLVSGPEPRYGDNVVVLQRLVPYGRGLRTIERRVSADTEIVLEPEAV